MTARSLQWAVCSLALAGCTPLSTQHSALSTERAEPVAVFAEGGGVTVSLYQEPCARAAVSNLPYRATWRDAAGKTFEGCAAVQHGSVVVMYFDDRTVVTVPVRAFGAPSPAGPAGIRF
jgi:hypothetical protein